MKKNNEIDFNYKKIMLISYRKLSDNKYKLKYALDLFIDTDDIKSLFINSVTVDYDLIKQLKKMKFGIWHDKRKFKNNDNYYYVYIKPNKELVFKTNKYNNWMRIGESNSYNHRLLYKFYISNDYKTKIVE